MRPYFNLLSLLRRLQHKSREMVLGILIEETNYESTELSLEKLDMVSLVNYTETLNVG